MELERRENERIERNKQKRRVAAPDIEMANGGTAQMPMIEGNELFWFDLNN